MPRYSKHRGKGKKIYSKQLPGTSRHKVCVVAAIIVSDDSYSIQTFVSENKFEHDIIPSNAFTTPKGNSVSSINEMHTQIKNLIRWKHEYLQGTYKDILIG